MVSKGRLLQPYFPYYLLKETGGRNTEGENPGWVGVFLAVLESEKVFVFNVFSFSIISIFILTKLTTSVNLAGIVC